ncbi:MAG TPA: NAD(P)H-dependent glycerol-3-phosphate dehydrogenase [bacterium]|nr:NAD(P)H-dependent glycerol-3-phosphate dehydrogenase [bacterium]
MKVAVIGSGNMGTALAHLLADNGHTVSCWDHMPDVVEDIRKNHQNSRFLPGITLPTSVTADLLLNHVVREAQMIFIGVPSLYFRQVVKEFSPFSVPQAVVVGTSKGLEASTHKRMSQVYAEAALHNPDHYVALSGPSIANEFARKRPTAVVLACPSHGPLHKAAGALANPYFRVETSGDMVGVEVGGVLKNIYAIGFGLLDGLNHGSPNLKAAFVTMALKEMKEMAVTMGAQEKTLDGLAGLGDLVTTGFSADSHNRQLGECLAQGMEYDKAISQLGGVVPEGVRAVAMVLETVGSTVETPLAHLIQTSIQQPAARAKFVDEVWKIVS